MKPAIEKAVFPLEKLPRAIHHYGLFSFLTARDLYRLAKTSKNMLNVYCSSPGMAQKLLAQVLHGNEQQALAIIAADPKHLFSSAKSEDYSGRIFDGCTPFQAALRCGDSWLWKKMEPFFEMLPDGKLAKQKQFQALFPNGIPPQSSYDFTTIVELLSNARDRTALDRAIVDFRREFSAISLDEVLFNPMHFMGALECYQKYFSTGCQFKSALFCQKIIGYIQRFFPACYAQAFAQGLCQCLRQEDSPLVRSLVLKDKDGDVSFFPLNASSGLGFDYAIFSVSMGTHVKQIINVQPLLKCFSDFYQLHQRELVDLARRIEADSISHANDDTSMLLSCCTIA